MPESYLALFLTIGIAFTLAGFVKGVIGMGLPTVAMGLLGLIMTPAQGAAILVIPSIVTNTWQLLAGPSFVRLLKRLWSFLLCICLGVWSGFGLMRPENADFATTALGTVLVIYGLLGLFRVRFSVPPRAETWLSPLMGYMTGVVAAATGVFTVPGVIYVQAMNLERDDLIQALGLMFSISTFALAVNLFRDGMLQLAILPVSLAALLAAALGMTAGTWLRHRTSPETFRKVFFFGMFALGAHLALHKFL
jgi:uncharacterized membrane protein YfcA